MMEWIKNARLGWLDYIESGKLAALLLLALLIFWFWKKEEWNKYRKLFLYTTLVTVCCVVPVTAAVLMAYQTKFYDYEWIWGTVPITAVIALTGTLLWSELSKRYQSVSGGGWKKAGIVLLAVCLLYVCGPLGAGIPDAEEEQGKLAATERVLEIVTENGQNRNVVLWAPREIMEYARALNGTVQLPYGRNMWDPALNAYSYEAYGDTEVALYDWMTGAEETGTGEGAILEPVLEIGINCMVLPGNLALELLAEFEKELGVQAELADGYYLFRIK